MNILPRGTELIDTTGMDLTQIDWKLLENDGHIRLLPAHFYTQFSPIELRVWCNARSRYSLPTVELVRWLKKQIGTRSALEVGAGSGNLGFHLGIPMTDSYQQVDDALTVTQLALYSVAAVRPPAEVEKEDAENAVRRRKPQVVIASYLTQKYNPRDGHDAEGNYRGVRHDYIIERCETFIMIGNASVHGKMRALKLPHEELYFPWIITRSKEQSLNRIWVWQNK